MLDFLFKSNKIKEENGEKSMRKFPSDITYVAATGGFTLKNGTSYQCRDQFQSYFNSSKNDEFYFACGKGSGQDVVDFIKMVELVSGVEEENKLVIEITSRSDFVYVMMSEWWFNPVRRSLLTIFLRAGRKYTSKNTGAGFVAALYSDGYSKSTNVAIDYFMSGHIDIKNKSVSYARFNGWYNLFHSQTQPSKVFVRKKRQKPVGPKEKVENSDE